MSEFDKKIARRNTESVKWDSIVQTYHADDLLPLWVADMDFLSPVGVKQAFEQYISHGLFGYSIVNEGLYESVIDWEKRQHDVSLKKENIVFTSGVLASLAVAIQTFTDEGDPILIHDPVYPPFASIVENNQRQLVRSKLIEKDHKFMMDFADMEKKIITEKIKVMILCNPHNPGGRVWTKDELEKVADLCLKHNVILFSDEIHQDLVFAPHTFTSMLTVNEALNDSLIVFTSATKTFNLAAIKNSMVFIKDPTRKALFEKRLVMNQQHEINTFGLIGTKAAYDTGIDWLNKLLPYLESNANLAQTYFNEHLPELGVMKPEGTYLMWLDFSAYEEDDHALEQLLVTKGKVVLNPGITFGPSGHAHMRLNLACPKEVLLEGLERIKKTFVQ